MAMRKPGVYVALSANYADDEKIMEAGEDAELLYIRMLAYCARTPLTEGWISERVILSRLGILPRMTGTGAGIEPGTDAGSRAEKLREVGLISREGEGFRITSWLKWNKSAEEMGRERARDRQRKTSANDGTGTGNDAGTDAGTGPGLPDPIRRADQNTDQNQKQSTPAKRATSLPADWEPTQEHIERAAQDGIDLGRELIKFRAYVDEKGLTSKSWNQRFTRWLMQAADYAKARPGGNVTAITGRPRRDVGVDQWLA
ncbi:DnaT-like ssDNA-binding domain-containing protein [Georgenia thermotolerans]|uniref:DnaT-like ssDNA-binding domain-containing protein n=1 Tax=Georgenia thermotolerans TaxID=527326 RepID=UPI0012657651|nr:DnaT-like ssDNA-binding domain-containing protein [Georgenia thermotolerans]